MDRNQVEIAIEDFSPRGFGVGASPCGKSKIEVAHAIVGDKVRVDLSRRRRRVMKGRLLEILGPSEDRIELRCAHASLCGGCCWQAMDYSVQARRKQERIFSYFQGMIGKDADIRPFLTCEQPWRYRNKMEFSFSENRAGTRFLGLMIAHAEPYVFNLEECHLAPEWMSECLLRVKAWWEASGIKAFHPPADSGSLRYLTLREGVHTGQKMAVLNVSGNPAFALTRADLDGFVQAVGSDISIFLRIHQTIKGVPTRFFEMHLGGADHIVEEMRLAKGVLRFRISPSSFFQPNTLQAEKLYDAAISMLGEADVVYDLYCGTGTLAMAAARQAREVLGIELSPEAVLDAKENAKANGLPNVSFLQGDVGAVLSKQSARSKPDAIIVDPPRAGLDEAALKQIEMLGAQKIVYISCNPATQAENARVLIQAGYRIAAMQGVDQFPHTAHIENIALFIKRA